MAKQTQRRGHKYNAIYWILLTFGVAVTIYAAQSVALWLPWSWADGLAANATVWPILQLVLSIAVFGVAAGFYYLLRPRMAAVFVACGVVTILPVIAMYMSLGFYARTHDISLDMLAQTHVVRGDYQAHQVVNYGQNSNNRLELSVYRNSNITRRSPAVVYVHGGGWAGGSRTENSEFFRWLNDRGYSVYSIDYRYASEGRATWQTAPRDVACALSWLNENADAQQVDRDNVTIMGDSAGGQLALRAAYGVKSGDIESSCSGEPVVPGKVAAIVPAVDFTELYNDPRRGGASQANVVNYLGGTPESSPDAYEDATIINHVRQGLQPTLIINASNDMLVAPESGVRLAEALHNAGVDTRQYTLPYAVHSYWINPGGYQMQTSRELIARFLE